MVTVRSTPRGLLRLVLSCAAGLLVIMALQHAARAGGTHTIIVPADDGYGIQDCLASSKGCGEIVAAAWCEVKGYSTPLAFGRAETVTGATATAQNTKLNPDDFIVTCAD
jgi:hypothetical protein